MCKNAKIKYYYQEVAQQNDELRAEIEQLSAALASATTFIEDTANNYQALYERLLESDKIIERLTNDNELLSKKVKLKRIISIIYMYLFNANVLF